MLDKYDITIIIPTFNRENKLKNLLNQINNEKNNYNILIIIIDDGSKVMYNLKNYNVSFIRFIENNGKKNYWNLVNHYFKLIKNINSDYFIVLADDLEIKVNFFNKSIKIFNEINDDKKICLSLLNDSRIYQKNWTNFKLIEYDNVYKTQWNDLCFIAKKNFFNILEYKINPISENRWKYNSNLSSGVGEQISVRLFNLGYNMYHVKESLVIHGNHKSEMNFEERIKNPIINI